MLTVAHRLDTIINSDVIICMEQGKAVEVDHPFRLLTREFTDNAITASTHFAGMVGWCDVIRSWSGSTNRRTYLRRRRRRTSVKNVLE